jgi:hypothetical protein
MDAFMDRVLVSEQLRGSQPIRGARKKNVGCIRNSDKQRSGKWPGWAEGRGSFKEDNGPA